jgi:hypothetical protein
MPLLLFFTKIQDRAEEPPVSQEIVLLSLCPGHTLLSCCCLLSCFYLLSCLLSCARSEAALSCARSELTSSVGERIR